MITRILATLVAICDIITCATLALILLYVWSVL